MGRKNGTSARVRTLIEGGSTSLTELVDKLGKGERTRINSAIQNLTNQGKIARTGRGTFKATDKLAASVIRAEAKMRRSDKRSRAVTRDARDAVPDDGSTEQVIRALERHIGRLNTKLAIYEEALQLLRSEVETQ